MNNFASAIITLTFLFIVFWLTILHLRITGKRPHILRFLRIKRKNVSTSEYEAFVFQLAYALKWMSDHNTGALVVIENKESLQQYIALGYQVRASLTAEFLISIFSNKKSALHDGGVVIRKFEIVSVSSYFPVTQTRMVHTYGARHRAATGLTEHIDAVAFLVSETTGKISFSKEGKLYELTTESVNDLADEIFNLINFYIV